MNPLSKEMESEHDLPALLELLRALSGVFAIVALLTIAVGVALLGEWEEDKAVVPTITQQAKPRLAPTSPATQVTYFYLIDSSTDPLLIDDVEYDHSPGEYQLLFTGDEGELLQAGQRILTHLLVNDYRTEVEVIDLRGDNSTQTPVKSVP